MVNPTDSIILLQSTGELCLGIGIGIMKKGYSIAIPMREVGPGTSRDRDTVVYSTG